MRHQKVVAAEHVEWKEAVLTIVPAKVPPDLVPVDQVVGVVEVEHNLVGRRRHRGHKVLEKGPMHGPGPRTVRAALQAAKSRWMSQGAVTSNSGLQRHISSQRLVIVEVFVTERKREDPLLEHRP